MNTRPGYSMPSPARSGPNASVNDGHGYGPYRCDRCSSSSPTASADCCASTPAPGATATVTSTWPGYVHHPSHQPQPAGRDRKVAYGTGAPVARCHLLAGCHHLQVAWGGMRTSKSAVADVDVSLGMCDGGSSAQPWLGTHGSTGKNEPSRSALPRCEMRSRAPWGSRSENRHGDRRRAAGRQPPGDRQCGRIGQPGGHGAAVHPHRPVARRAPSARRLAAVRPQPKHDPVGRDVRREEHRQAAAHALPRRRQIERDRVAGPLRVGRGIGGRTAGGVHGQIGGGGRGRSQSAAGRRHQRQDRCQRRTREAHDLGIGSRGRAVKRGRSDAGLDRGVVAVAPLVPGAVVDVRPPAADPLHRKRDRGGRDAAVAVGDGGAPGRRRRRSAGHAAGRPAASVRRRRAGSCMAR